MTIQDLKNLDYYYCSLQDIIKAENAITNYCKKLINKGHCTANNYKGTDIYNEAKTLRLLISRARRNMTPDGFMIMYNNDLDRLPNDKSIL